MNSGAVFSVKISVARQVAGPGGLSISRDDFYLWLWDEFASKGLQGVHEGTVLAEQIVQAGAPNETVAWSVDAAEAPRERDWVSNQAQASAELYFGSELEAKSACQELGEWTGLEILGFERVENQDWDAQWKASFLGNGQGVKVPPFWRILPPWSLAAEANLLPSEIVLRINPGAGFGTGTHETTQLCLQAIGEISQARGGLAGKETLDFGSGSGILSIGAALCGARVRGVEIDPLANDNATENASLNGVGDRVEFARTLSSAPGTYPLVIANILKPVLLEFASELVRRMEPQGALVLSGLIESDVEEVVARYSALLLGRQAIRLESGEWRALVWK